MGSAGAAPSEERRTGRRAAERGDGNAVTRCPPPDGEATDKNAPVEAAARRTADADQHLAAEQVEREERVIGAPFGSLEHPGVIAEGLKRGETVTVLGFGAFRLDDDRVALRPGRALNEYVSGAGLRGGAAGAEPAAAGLQVGAYEPLEQLQTPQSPDEHVPGDRVGRLDGLHGLTVVLDHTRVDEVQGTEVPDGFGPPDRVVVPSADRPRSSGRASTSGADRSARAGAAAASPRRRRSTAR